MLDEAEPAIGDQHPSNFDERSGGVGDRAEPESADNRVEAVRFEGQFFRRSLEGGEFDSPTARASGHTIHPLEQT